MISGKRFQRKRYKNWQKKLLKIINKFMKNRGSTLILTNLVGILCLIA